MGGVRVVGGEARRGAEVATVLVWKRPAIRVLQGSSGKVDERGIQCVGVTAAGLRKRSGPASAASIS